MAFDPADYMTLRDAAQLLGLAPEVAYGELQELGLPVVTVGNGRAVHLGTVEQLRSALDARAVTAAA